MILLTEIITFNNGSDITSFNINTQIPENNTSSSHGISGTLTIFQPNASANTVSIVEAGAYDQFGSIQQAATGSNRYTEFLSTTAVNAIQFKFGSGNIASGEITMFGIKNS